MFTDASCSYYDGMMNLRDQCTRTSMDQTIILLTEGFIKSKQASKSFGLKGPERIDFSILNLKDKVSKFIDYGIHLIDCGAMPQTLEIVLQDIYEDAVFGSTKEVLEKLRIHLLFVKKSVQLLHQGQYDDYFYLISQIASNNLNIGKYEDFFLK